MARVAREIDRDKLDALKKRLEDAKYVSLAVQVIAYRLTHHFFEEVRPKKGGR